MSRRISPYLIALSVVLLATALVLLTHLPARLAALKNRSLKAAAGREMVTMPKIDYLSVTEQEVIAELNRARANPQQYAALLEQLKQTATGNEIKLGQKSIKLQEGLSVLDEAIKFLRAAQPLPPLSTAKGLCLSARDHVKDLGMSGNTGHKGTDGSLPDQRVNRYGSWQAAIGENIAYNSGQTRDAVLGMIIDDGTPTRGHRKNIFDPNFQVAGIAIGPPSSYGLMCVLDFAGGYVEKGQAAMA